MFGGVGRVAGEASEFGQAASRGADAGTAIFSPMKGSNTIHGDISMEVFHPMDHPIVQQQTVKANSSSRWKHGPCMLRPTAPAAGSIGLTC
jgi:hypothetical protein